MYQLNKRVGFFKKRLAQNEGEKFHYFFIGNSGLMYFDQNWYRVRSVINLCKTVEEVEEKMIKEEFKFIEIKKYQISTTISNHPYGDSVPFTNKLCFEMIFVQNQYQSLQLFGLSDDTDITDLYNFVKTIDASSPSSQKKDNVDNSPHQMNVLSSQIEKTDVNEKNSNFFSYVQQQYLQKIEESKEDNKKQLYLYDLMTQYQNQYENPSSNNGEQQMQELSDQVTYSGQMVDNNPHGNGKEFSNDGIQYEGSYRYGKRHGPGQFVDSNLDMHQYEYIQGRPVGI